MALRCVIMQPTYLPWLGYFDLIRRADVFVVLDHVQFEKQSWQQKNRIRNKAGEILLTLPVLHEKGLERRVKDVRIDNSRNALKKHLTSIQLSYSKAMNFGKIYPEIENIYLAQQDYLIDMNISLINVGMKYLGIKKEFMYSSKMDVQGTKVDALVDICKKVGATNYLSPVGSKAYIDENNIFADNGITLEYQQFTHPTYAQLNYPDFISHLAFIDYLFNTDLKESLEFGSFKTAY
jgi:hypothetical protein